MKRLAAFLAFIGLLLIVGAGMIAIDGYLTTDRKDGVRSDLTTRLERNAQQYEQNRADGCRRNCGFLPTLSHTIVGLRDGIFLSVPFEPEAVFPLAPAGWTVSEYALPTVEDIVERTLRRTPIFVSTQNNLLKDFDDIANANGVGAVRIYTQDDKTIAMALMIDRNGLRAAKDDAANIAKPVAAPFVAIDGLPVQSHERQSTEGSSGTWVPVTYSHYSMDIDGQVRIALLARAAEDDIQLLLSQLDLTPIVQDLPQIPSSYDPAAGMMIFEVSEESEDQ